MQIADGGATSSWLPRNYAALAQVPPVPQAASGAAALSSAQMLEMLRTAGKLEVTPPEAGQLRFALARRGVAL